MAALDGTALDPPAAAGRRSKVVVYRVGLCYASVCAPHEMPVDLVERETNHQYPTGLDHGWKVSDEPAFSDGHRNPCPCNLDPDSRVHRLLVC